MRVTGKSELATAYGRTEMVMPPTGGTTLMSTTEYDNLSDYPEYADIVKKAKIKSSYEDKMIQFMGEELNVYIIGYGTIKDVDIILFHNDDIIFRKAGGLTCKKISFKGKHIVMTHIPRGKTRGELYIEVTNVVHVKNCESMIERTPEDLVEFNGNLYRYGGHN